MRKLTILAIMCLLGMAFSANAAENGTPRKHGPAAHKTHPTHQTRQPDEDQPEKPAVMRIPVSPDTFRA